MYTRMCKNCGWEHPPSYIGRKCIICGQLFDVLKCITCGEIKPADLFVREHNQCKACKLKHKNAHREQHRINLENQFEEWLDKIRRVPKSYPTLTGEQWIEACRHFDGCARCSSKDIDSRGFFVGAKLGGRYCDWNIIPLCERCANTWNLNKSAFKYIEKRAYNMKDLSFKSNLSKIIDYLGGKLDNAVNKEKAE